MTTSLQVWVASSHIAATIAGEMLKLRSEDMVRLVWCSLLW